MITHKQIIDGIDEVFYVVRDINGNIVEPTDKKILKKYKEILTHDLNDSEYYVNDQKYYKKISKSIMDKKSKQYYIIEYFYCVPKTNNNEFDIDTRLFTKEATNNYINEYLIHAIRNKENFGVLFIDIDNFKSLNDTYGHIYCDQLLSKIGDVIIENTRQRDNKDIIGRVGGDEFVVLLKNVSKEICLNKAETLMDNISEIKLKEYKHDERLNLTVSIGLYFVDDYEYSEISNLSIIDARNTIIKRSDEAMYNSKNNGKNTVSVYKRKLVKYN